MREIHIRNWREPFPEKKGIAIIFDIFRCSTTLACLMSHRDSNVWVARNLDSVKSQARHFKIFSELNERIECFARFDNSPAEALYPENTEDKDHPFLVSTTSGTPAMFAARGFEEVWVGSLTNFSALVRALAEENRNITLLPAADPESNHVEDGIVAQDLAIALDGFCLDKNFVESCARKSIEKIIESGRKEFLEKKLLTGIPDMRLALELNRYDTILKINFQSGTNIPGLAKVMRWPTG